MWNDNTLPPSCGWQIILSKIDGFCQLAISKPDSHSINAKIKSCENPRIFNHWSYHQVMKILMCGGQIILLKNWWMTHWLCWDLTTCQPFWVILCCLPEKGRKEIEEILEEIKERDRKKAEQEWKWKTNRRNKNILPLPLPAIRN